MDSRPRCIWQQDINSDIQQMILAHRRDHVRLAMLRVVVQLTLFQQLDERLSLFYLCLQIADIPSHISTWLANALDALFAVMTVWQSHSNNDAVLRFQW